MLTQTRLHEHARSARSYCYLGMRVRNGCTSVPLEHQRGDGEADGVGNGDQAGGGGGDGVFTLSQAICREGGEARCVPLAGRGVRLIWVGAVRLRFMWGPSTLVS